MVFAFVCGQTASSAEPPISLMPAGAGLPFTLRIGTTTTNNFLLQSTTDLQEWHPFLHVFSRLESFRIVDRSSLQERIKARFFRVSGSALTLSEMSAAWQNLNIKRYRFTFSRTCFCTPYTLQGTVTVQDGEVVTVENVVDAINPVAPRPIENPNLSEFKSVEQLFHIIPENATTADILTVQLNETIPFPSWVDIDSDVTGADEEITYRVSDFERLE